MASSTPTSIDESLGARATKIAQEKAKLWLDNTWQVVSKTVLDTAARGLFHCNIRFVDVIPADVENQNRLLKLLQTQNLKGSFTKVDADEEKGTEAAVILTISWGAELL